MYKLNIQEIIRLSATKIVESRIEFLKLFTYEKNAQLIIDYWIVRIREKPVKSITERISRVRLRKINLPPLAVTCL